MPERASVLIDANIFIYHLSGISADCTSLLQRAALSEIESYVTTIIIAEVLHRRMQGEAIAKGLIASGQVLKKLKANPQIISQLKDYITDVKEILELPLTIIEVSSTDIAASHALRRNHGLFVNDSINLACAQRIGITDIVTHDNDFARLPTITVWEPTDI
jgi:Predicted nucleic acid-binding protein, contains PIN domain